MHKYPKTPLLRQLNYDIKRRYEYIGNDNDGEPIYDSSLIKPIIDFKGTVKLHGANVTISFNDNEGLTAHSKENIITKELECYGFYKYFNENKEYLLNCVWFYKLLYNIDTSINTISVTGEWCGGSVSSGCGIKNIENKSFFIFSVRSKSNDGDRSIYYNSCGFINIEKQIYNINDFKTFDVSIDFNKLDESVDILTKLTQEVQKECPVTNKLIKEGRINGEGIVWVGYYDKKRYIFKTKGDKHKTSKERKPVTFDVEKFETIKKFIDYAVTDNRFNQAVSVVYCGEPKENKHIGNIIKWVIKDINDEENDVLLKSGLIIKDVYKQISDAVYKKFFKL